MNKFSIRQVCAAVLGAAAFAIVVPQDVEAKSWFSGSSKSGKKDGVEQPKESQDSTDLKKIIGESKVSKGLFTTYLSNKGKLLMEIPDSALTHTYLLVNRVKRSLRDQGLGGRTDVRQPHAYRLYQG